MIERQREIKWPNKKVDKIGDEDYIDGWNACLEACKKAVEGQECQPKLHACKCRNDEEGAMTVKRLDEGLFQCPRCSGIIIPKPVSMKVEVLEKMLASATISTDGKMTITDYGRTYELKDVTENKSLNKFLK